VVSGVGLAFVIPRALRLVALVRSGAPSPGRFDHLGWRTGYALQKILGQKKLLQWTGPGLAHAFTFWGFLVIQVALIESFGEFFWKSFTLPIIGTWSWVGTVFDFFVLAVGTALISFAVVRIKNNPRFWQRQSRFFNSHMGPAYLILAMIFGIIATLLVCTVLYIAVVVVLTGLVPWQSLLDDAAPVVNTLRRLHLTTIRLIVLFGALMGMISSLLVFQLGQARVWFAMSRDGLLPRVFSRVHPRFRTPDFSTWIAGIVVGIPSGIFDIGTLADLSNIGTLFAFALVAGGVLILRFREPDRHRSFRAPLGLTAPIVTILTCLLLMAGLPIWNWLRFFVWLLLGLVFYYFYGRRYSTLRAQSAE